MINYYDIDTVREWYENINNGLDILDAALNLNINNPEDCFICGNDDIDEFCTENNYESEEIENWLMSHNGWWFKYND